ncbi:ChbG/HpnK family deacetylase [Microvirga tunisiensis]|uniref:ChbG/HpnK family deacetylase n=2 Tax=Pannonibacter tanglangensis TaxID=2750084 RepID=A0A7X5F3C4_9HYPH|nr:MULTISPECIES: ChbG/HpnK family deacetylase [unclassified Pannonibacter]NBN64495.1 ChbG/HpnK family deacetylase [Pannonibacter sp. XCT-34]NBN79027.1 ChbG/HpnK family deacetylase [Pannonibacter sp. XCT-53]
MKRITLAAVDYGLAFGVDRAIRDLLSAGRLSAVACLAASDLWSREYRPLQEVAEAVGGHALIGLNLVLSDPNLPPQSERWQTTFGARFRSPAWYARRALTGLLPDEVIQAELEAQIARFTSFWAGPPEFVSLRNGLMRHRPLARLVIAALKAQGVTPQPLLIYPHADGWEARRFARFAARAGLTTLPCGPRLPDLEEEAALQAALRLHFDGLPDRAVVVCRPGEADDRLRRLEPRSDIRIREVQRRVLASQTFFNTLAEKDVFLY